MVGNACIQIIAEYARSDFENASNINLVRERDYGLLAVAQSVHPRCMSALVSPNLRQYWNCHGLSRILFHTLFHIQQGYHIS